MINTCSFCLFPVNLAVTTPVMINSINPALTTATTTVASTPIPIGEQFVFSVNYSQKHQAVGQLIVTVE